MLVDFDEREQKRMNLEKVLLLIIIIIIIMDYGLVFWPEDRV